MPGPESRSAGAADVARGTIGRAGLIPVGREAADAIDAVSTDVFDTLLLRTMRSERARLMAAERQFSVVLRGHGLRVAARVLVEARLHAQRLAFRALNVGSVRSDVRLTDLVTRQLLILGLPAALRDVRIGIEVDVEKRSLRRNEALAATLRAFRRAGKRVVAISDTTLEAASLQRLVTHFYGPDLLDAIYSSADEGATKRDGALFLVVARRQGTTPARMLHIGDDPVADVSVPSRLGLRVRHVPRGLHRRGLRAANGVAARLGGKIAQASARAPAPAATDPHGFGRDVFGPIVTQFCLLVWLYACQAGSTDRAVLLFCTRGGIGIREAFERVLARLGLPTNVRRETLMISRLVAARAALLARSGAAAEELGREFQGATFAAVALALGGRDYRLPAGWREPFRSESWLDMLFAADGAEVLADLARQHQLFTRHLDRLSGDATRLILCDTGLYGSTQRLLGAGFPASSIESVLFARSNYKRHSEDHFGRVTGLLVERGVFDPFDPRTCVLRFWHVVESLFEPAVPSVRWFREEASGEVVSNAGDIRHGSLDPAAGNPLLAGTLDYIDSLPSDGGRVALEAADGAWRRLAQAIARPSEGDLRALRLGTRSVDFGRQGSVEVVGRAPDRHALAKLRALQGQLWREGAIAQDFPVLKHALLPLLGTLQSMRGVMFRLQR